jgi:hypothetical protein
MTDYVLTGLVARRRELAGEIAATQDRISKLIADLASLDSTILLFAPEYKIEGIKPKAFRPPKDWSNRGEMTKYCLDILRMAAEPMTSRDIALEMISVRALDKNDPKLLRLMSKRVGVALRGQRDQGLVKSEQGPGQYQMWTITS